MSEMEDRINSLLSSPDAMDKIMSVARSLGLNSFGSGGSTEAPPQQQPARDYAEQERRAPPAPPAPPAPDLDLGALDPKLLGMLSGLMSEYGRGDDQKANLLMALKPFLKPERAAKIDRAVQIARISRVIKAAYHGLKGGEGNV